MTLEEAIQHCKDEASKLRKDSAKRLQIGLMHAANDCEECAAEHEQLAGWLEELLEKRCKVIVQANRIKELEAEVQEQLTKRAEAYNKLYDAYAKIDELILAKEEKQ